MQNILYSFCIHYQAHFEAFGHVTEVTEGTDVFGRNYAFVTFANKEAAEHAMEAMDGEVLNGRKITVEWATRRGS